MSLTPGAVGGVPGAEAVAAAAAAAADLWRLVINLIAAVKAYAQRLALVLECAMSPAPPPATRKEPRRKRNQMHK
jgi:hypothetical protein